MSASQRRDFLRSSALLSATALLGSSLSAKEKDKSEAAAEGEKLAKAYADAIFEAGEPPLPQSGSFTVAVLPDTQYYSEKYPETYLAQTKWIAENREKRNILSVLHLGDITNRNTPEQWANARAAMNVLEGKLPYFLTLGNHDYGKGGGFGDRTTLYNDYFPLEKFRTRPEFGGTYDREPERFENCFHRLAMNSRKFLILSLETGPRRDVLRWANEIAKQFADHEAILLTHAYLYHDDTRYDLERYGSKQKNNPRTYGATKSSGDASDGEGMWQSLVSKHENFVFTINGHVASGDGLGKLVSPTPSGRKVPQILVDFQSKPNGGDGWLRLLEFKTDRTMQTYDYSPTLRKQNIAGENRFAVKLPKV